MTKIQEERYLELKKENEKLNMGLDMKEIKYLIEYSNDGFNVEEVEEMIDNLIMWIGEGNAYSDMMKQNLRECYLTKSIYCIDVDGDLEFITNDTYENLMEILEED